jgi:hypothetical protein
MDNTADWVAAASDQAKADKLVDFVRELNEMVLELSRIVKVVDKRVSNLEKEVFNMKDSDDYEHSKYYWDVDRNK